MTGSHFLKLTKFEYVVMHRLEFKKAVEQSNKLRDI